MWILPTIALRSLVKQRTRSLILGGSLATVTSLIVLLLALTAGIEDTMIRNGTALATGHVNVSGFYKLSQGSAAPLVTEFARVEALAKKVVPEAVLMTHRLKAYGNVIADQGSITIPMWGIDIERERSLLSGLQLAKPSSYAEPAQSSDVAPPTDDQPAGSIESLANRGTVVLFASHAKRLRIKVGDTITISMPTFRNVSNTKDLRVGAILADVGMMSSFTSFMHYEDAREVYQLAADTTGQVMIYLPNIEKVPEVENRLRQAFSSEGFELMEKEEQPYWMKFDRVSGESWTGQKIDITTWQDETAFMKWVLQLLQTLTVAFTAVLMMIIVVGLMNSLWMSVRERTVEIGTMRAFGLHRRDVRSLFGLEAAFLSLAGILTGVCVGSIIATILNFLRIPIESEGIQIFLMSNVLNFDLRFGDIALLMSLLMTCLIIAGLIPAYRASRLDPVKALAHTN